MFNFLVYHIFDQQGCVTINEQAFAQLHSLAPHLPANTIVALDRGYDASWLWCRCSTLPFGILGRLRSNRCLYRVAPEPSGKRGAPRKDGDKLQPKDPQSHGDPDEQVLVEDAKGRPVQISWWKRMHVKEARWLDVTVILVVRPHATNQERDPRTSWFVWIGDPEANIAEIALGYARRFGQEHGYRFEKQALLWDTPRLRTPEQFERWSQVVAIAHNHLVLARSLVEPELRPWENKQRASSPQQVRRGFSKLLARLGTPQYHLDKKNTTIGMNDMLELRRPNERAPSIGSVKKHANISKLRFSLSKWYWGTPAKPPQPRGKSKGRSKGAKVGNAPRFPVISKKPKAPHLVSS